MVSVLKLLSQVVAVAFFALAFLIWLSYEMSAGHGPEPLFGFEPLAILSPVVAGRLVNSVFVIVAASLGMGFWQLGKKKPVPVN